MFKFKITPDCHNAIQKLNYCVLSTPLIFRYHLLKGHTDPDLRIIVKTSLWIRITFMRIGTPKFLNFYFDADPDPAFRLMRIRIQSTVIMRIRIQPPMIMRIRIHPPKIMRIRIRQSPAWKWPLFYWYKYICVSGTRCESTPRRGGWIRGSPAWSWWRHRSSSSTGSRTGRGQLSTGGYKDMSSILADQ